MLDLERYSKRATEQFVELIQRKVGWIANSCWPSNLKSYLKEINTIIESAVAMGVTKGKPFSDEEIKELVSDLAKLRTLEMNGEVYGLLVKKLVDHDVDPIIFYDKK